MAYSYLQGSIDLNTENIYLLITSYFDNPILQKTKDDLNINGSVYMCKINSLLGGADQRYLVATTEKDNHPVGKLLPLDTIIWKSFQTRTLPLIPNLKKHSYSPKNEDHYLLPLTLVERYDDHTDYHCKDLNANVTLIHRNKNKYEYTDRGSIAAALETFQCVLRY
jgi:hypothetical protein